MLVPTYYYTHLEKEQGTTSTDHSTTRINQHMRKRGKDDRSAQIKLELELEAEVEVEVEAKVQRGWRDTDQLQQPPELEEAGDV